MPFGGRTELGNETVGCAAVCRGPGSPGALTTMHVVTHIEAPLYQASGHSLMLMRRLQGMEAGPSDTLWVGVSEIDPGGRATSSASDVEKFYICLEGEIEIAATKGDTTWATVLRPLD